MTVMIASAHFGWICGEERKKGEITGIDWTSDREKAKAYQGPWDKDLEEVRRWLEKNGTGYNLVEDYGRRGV